MSIGELLRRSNVEDRRRRVRLDPTEQRLRIDFAAIAPLPLRAYRNGYHASRETEHHRDDGKDVEGRRIRPGAFHPDCQEQRTYCRRKDRHRLRSALYPSEM